MYGCGRRGRAWKSRPSCKSPGPARRGKNPPVPAGETGTGADVRGGRTGAAFGGVAALLSMLNSCASGVSVVNIDNGFGAGFLASRINHLEGKRP